MFIIPPRGIIYDRNNLVLVENIEQYQLIYRYTNTKDKYDHLVQIFKHIDLEKDKKENLLKELSQKKSDFLQIVVKNDLPWNELAKISSNITELRGVFIEMILRRSYNSFSSHIVGY